MKKIMIVDDNHLSVQGIIRNINWKALDCEVVQMKYDGKSAINALNKEKIDIIISDIEMPDLDGISMSRMALVYNPLIKVILISAYDRFEYARRAIRIGVFDYIEKPVDYSYLSEKIQKACNIIDQEQKNRYLINQSRPLMIDKFFHDLLHYSGKEAEYYLSSYEKYLQLKLDYNFYSVVILSIENASDIKHNLGIEQYELKFYHIQNIVQQEYKIFNKFYILKDFDDLTLILCQNSTSSTLFLRFIHSVAEHVINQLKDTGIHLNIGIGNVASSLWNVYYSHKSALHALEYRFFFPQKNIFDSKEALGKDLSLEPLSETRNEELIQLICQKDYTALEAWIKHFAADTIQKCPTKSILFIKVYSLLIHILRFLCELNIDTSDLEDTVIHLYSELDSIENNNQLFSWLLKFCMDSCKKLEQSLKTYHSHVCDLVLNYIKNNYSNHRLCLKEIAGYANVSPTYLSALFKKKTHMSISDTITSCRIEAACQYLKNTQLSLKEISEHCGYTNQYYFSTSFKKKMGISPSAFRESAEGGADKNP